MISVVLFQCSAGHQCPISGYMHAQLVVHAVSLTQSHHFLFHVHHAQCSFNAFSVLHVFDTSSKFQEWNPLHKKSHVNVNGLLFVSYQYICTSFLLQWCYPTSNMKVSTSSLISTSDIFAPFSETSNSRSRNASLFFFPAIIIYIYKIFVFLLAEKVVSLSF